MTSPDCPFKSNQRQSKILILTPKCAVWLCGVMHTAELDSTEGCTLWSLSPRCASHHGIRLLQNVRFLVFEFKTSFNYVYKKIYSVKKIPSKNLWRHYREITIIKFRIKTDTWQVTDSTVWCTLRGLTLGMMHTAEFLYTFFMTLLCDAHRRTWLRGRGGMHTAELDSMGWCTPGSLTQQYDAQWCTPQSF